MVHDVDHKDEVDDAFFIIIFFFPGMMKMMTAIEGWITNGRTMM